VPSRRSGYERKIRFGRIENRRSNQPSRLGSF
jgi:hypothetical protein